MSAENRARRVISWDQRQLQPCHPWFQHPDQLLHHDQSLRSPPSALVGRWAPAADLPLPLVLVLLPLPFGSCPRGRCVAYFGWARRELSASHSVCFHDVGGILEIIPKNSIQTDSSGLHILTADVDLSMTDCQPLRIILRSVDVHSRSLESSRLPRTMW